MHTPEKTHSTDTPTSLPDRTKRKKAIIFDPLMLSLMSYTFSMTDTLTILLALSSKPWNLGFTIGKLLCHIPPLISTHLENVTDYRSSVPRALADMSSFVTAVDDYVAHLRLTDESSKKFPLAPKPNSSDRKAKASQRKYVDKFTYLTEANFKLYISENFGGGFRKWSKWQTQAFNKGVDKAVSGVQWVVYPRKNVVFEAGSGYWGGWLRNECEELEMEKVTCGRRALQGK